VARIASKRAHATSIELRKAEKKDDSRCFVEEVSGKVLPLLALSNAHAPELIGVLNDPEESKTSPETTRETRS
jgi:hypothetical protein